MGTENVLSTAIKFVSANADTGSATTGVETGDITMMVVGIIVALLGAGVLAACYMLRKRATGGVAGVSAGKSTFAMTIIAAITVVLGLSLACTSSSSIKAHASEQALKANDFIGKVDENTGAVTFEGITIINSSDTTQAISRYTLNAADGVTTLNNVVWTIKVEDIEVFTGKIGDTVEAEIPLPIPSGESLNVTLSVANLTPELAKSLIGKTVASGSTTYEEISVEEHTVSATVSSSSAGSVNPTSVTVLSGTEYEVKSNVVEFTDGQKITASANSGFVFSSWSYDGKTLPTSGTIDSDVEVCANFGDQPVPTIMSVSIQSNDDSIGIVSVSQVKFEGTLHYKINANTIEITGKETVTAYVVDEYGQFSCWDLDDVYLDDGAEGDITSNGSTFTAMFSAAEPVWDDYTVYFETVDTGCSVDKESVSNCVDKIHVKFTTENTVVLTGNIGGEENEVVVTCTLPEGKSLQKWTSLGYDYSIGSETDIYSEEYFVPVVS